MGFGVTGIYIIIAQCYGQFGELSYKNKKLLKAVRRSEVRLIRLTESVGERIAQLLNSLPPVLQ